MHRGVILTLCIFFISLSTAHAQGGPPKEDGPHAPPELVELVSLDPTIRLDIRYATSNNFVGRAVYKQARAFLNRPAAEALLRAHRALLQKGHGLLIFDGYRPWSVTKIFWDMTPPSQRAFVANPAKGSRHNRGCAVDLSLYEVKTGKTVTMPSEYDEPSDRSHPDYTGGTREARALRDLLRRAMEKEGFTVEPNEWWHYNFGRCPSYAVLNIPFEEIQKGKR